MLVRRERLWLLTHNLVELSVLVDPQIFGFVFTVRQVVILVES